MKHNATARTAEIRTLRSEALDLTIYMVNYIMHNYESGKQEANDWIRLGKIGQKIKQQTQKQEKMKNLTMLTISEIEAEIRTLRTEAIERTIYMVHYMLQPNYKSGKHEADDWIRLGKIGQKIKQMIEKQHELDS